MQEINEINSQENNDENCKYKQLKLRIIGSLDT